MGDTSSISNVEAAVAWHGHLCPALAIGVRICEAIETSIRGLEMDRRLVVYAGAVTPALDALQSLLGLTVGNGGLVLAPELGADTLAVRVRCDLAMTIKLMGDGLSMGWDCPSLRSTGGENGGLDDGAEAGLDRASKVLGAPQRDLFSIERSPSWRSPWAALGVWPSSEHVVLLRPIGVVHSPLKPGAAPPRVRVPEAVIEIRPELADGLKGIERFQHLQVLFRFSRSPRWDRLQQHPQGDRSKEVRGIWALRSPHRPNGIGLTTVRLLGVAGTRVRVAGLDAWDGTPVLDIKPYIAWLDEADSSGRP
ncbi:MAG: tRNA (N6-threonylcarbamoyladenosine(37)-N6)-methyltransferase TrmO [Anaerolineae bacterium]